MKRSLYAPAVLFVGLLSAQLIATAHVYFSNLNLLKTIDAITANGYLTVPNAHVAKNLDSLPTAMAGGLFFTLSIGAGLSLVTVIVIWLWDRFFRRGRTATTIIGVGWVSGLFLINNNGWNVAGTTYLVVVPLMTGICAIALLPQKTARLSSLGVLWPVSVAVILALSWSIVLDKNLFTNVRDHLLLSNPIGESITNAYYAYTLYPAEAFKSLSQKQIRTCRLGNSFERSQWNRMEKIVRIRDYLPVTEGPPVDLTIEQDVENDQLLLKDHLKTVLQFSERDFFRDPDKALNAFSLDQDRNAMFRTVTLGCLMLGFPLVLLTLSFSFLSVLPNLFLTETMSDIVAGILCIGVGIALLVPVYQGQRAMASPDFSADDLGASSTVKRIAALKKACYSQSEISREAIKYGIHQSSNIAERYWLTRNLVYSKSPQVSAELLALANDPAPIVACQALWALGQRKDRSAVSGIIEVITSSSHWYLQMYGYRTLKALGWVQPRSPQSS